MRLTAAFLVAGIVAAASAAAEPPDPRLIHRAVVREALRATLAGRAYQGRDRGPEQTERFSRKVKIGRDGRVSINNISGDITVTAGGGDEVSIEALKRTRGDQRELGEVRILVDERAGRVDVRTDYGSDRGFRNNNSRVSVDFTIVLPATASIDVKSISGSVKVTGVRGAVRAESISGNVTTADTPKVETAKSISGNVTLSGIAIDGDLSAGTVSGTVTAKGVKAHALELGSVSGDMVVTDVTCDRLNAKSVSGGFEYTGAITRGGVYDVNVHSGTVRFVLSNPSGFELSASTFSGSIRSDLPLTIGGDRDSNARRRGVNNRSMRATFGDGSATLTLRTFSGNIVIEKR
jgi:putative adhesin